MSFFTQNRTVLFLSLLILIGAFLRLYNLNWGAPFYFHPDERNIASSISQLSFPSNLNPEFFAYGSFPLYIIFFTGLVVTGFSACIPSLESCLQGNSVETFTSIRFEDAIIIGRIYSSVFAIALIPILFVLGKKFGGEKTGYIAAFLTTFSVGLTQFAHFATFEMWTTFFAIVQLLVAFDFIKTGSKRTLYLLALLTGILVSIKVSNLVLLAVPAVAILIQTFQSKHGKQTISFYTTWLLKSGISIFALCLFTLTLFLLTNPYSYLAFESFKGSIRYESEVALGTLPVFYTGEFFNTTPVVFQLVKVLPFLLNPFVLVVSLASLFGIMYVAIKEKNAYTAVLLISFLVLFLSQSFLFVKWVRYMIPTIPFLYLITAVAIGKLLKINIKPIRIFSITMLGGVVLSSILFSVSYFITVYVEKDTRLLARDFARQHIPPDAPIISEVYDLGITPFNDYFGNITLIHFYDLEHPGTDASSKLHKELTETDYIILPSQRILATRMNNPEEFPNGYAFYNSLQTNKSTYTKIYETPCSVFCQITYLGDPIDRYEGTANVFDRPHLIIYEITH